MLCKPARSRLAASALTLTLAGGGAVGMSAVNATAAQAADQHTVVITAQATGLSTDGVTAKAQCPANTYVTGGGFWLEGFSVTDTVQVVWNSPLTDGTQGWTTLVSGAGIVDSTGKGAKVTITVHTYAICADE